MGEALLKNAAEREGGDVLGGLEIVSAGTSTVDGMPPSATSVEALKHIGVDISQYRSNFLTQEMVDEAFAIFAMAQSHIDILRAHYKNLPERVFTAMQMVEGSPKTDIADPYGGGLDEYLDARDDIALATAHILKYLKNEISLFLSCPQRLKFSTSNS